MRNRMMVVAMGAALLCLATSGWAEEPKKAEAEPAVAAQPKVSVSAKDTKLTDVLESLGKQSKEQIIVESTVKGTLPSLSLTDVSLEAALNAVCKAGKIEWRKIYIEKDSKLLEKPDKFAAVVRLLGGLSFPDMMVAGASTGKTAVHLTDGKAIDKAREKLVSDLGFGKVYLVTNDTASAARALAKEDSTDSAKSPAVERFTQLSKTQMEEFMKMSAEEREQAMFAGINLMDQVDPSYMSTVMQTLMNSDPENLRRVMAKQTEVLFHMPDDERRAMMKLNMQIATQFTPEQLKILQEDQQAIMKEIQAESGK